MNSVAEAFPIRPPASALDAGVLDPSGRESFSQMLARADREASIRHAARALTAQALVAPILKELRANSTAWGPFRAGDAERTFGPMLDLAMADRIASSPRLGVAERIEARLRARTGEMA